MTLKYIAFLLEFESTYLFLRILKKIFYVIIKELKHKFLFWVSWVKKYLKFYNDLKDFTFSYRATKKVKTPKHVKRHQNTLKINFKKLLLV